MNQSVNLVAKAMKTYFSNDPDKVQHFVRVYTVAKTIGELEKLPEQTQEYLELACIIHEIGSVSGEQNRVTAAKSILTSNGVDDDTACRVCHIIENKENLEHITGLDHQILIEADMIVTFKEKNVDKSQIIMYANQHFITNYGKAFLKKAFGV